MHQTPPGPDSPASPSATFAIVHAAGDGAWSSHLLEAELRRRGHDVVAPDLPADDDSAGLWDYADVIVKAIGDRTDIAVVGHSFGAFTAPLVCTRVEVKLLVLLAPMIPAPGEPPDDWWTNLGAKVGSSQCVEGIWLPFGDQTGSCAFTPVATKCVRLQPPGL